MNKDFTNNGSTKKYLIILKGVIIGILTTGLFIAIFSGIMLLLELDKNFAAPFATVSIAFGTFAASFISARNIGNRGYLIGLIVGIITFTLITLIALIINSNGLSLNTLFHFIIIMLSSIIGGITGVNKGNSPKYL